ncbi:aminotransferase class I/II-fold pyridoxal phosphate-dependent enzyme [Oxyplasma meridianum]|uniref:Aminotransferase class I/II-fold pyridoxal phosphate-dependent enzyme n=1 Tax=Oxyplasma meridianum TaxID=3073602 RepID=A0AAX4NIC7_9ARCH
MKDLNVDIFTWIRKNIASCRYNLVGSGFNEPVLEKFGIDLSYDSYRKDSKDAPSMFKRAVADLYGLEEENVISTAGGTGGIFLANAYLQGRVKKMFIPAPEYEPMYRVPESLGIKVDYRTPSIDEIRKSEDSGFEFTNPNNPKGTMIDKDYLNSILEEADQGTLKIYSDETFRAFSNENPPGSIFNGNENVIVSNTMTKFYGLGSFRVGWIAAGGKVSQEIGRIKDLVTAENSGYSLWVASQALKNRKKFQEYARPLLDKNRSILKEFVESRNDLTWINPEFGSIAYIEYKGKTSSLDIAKKAMEMEKVLIVPGEYFNHNHGFRICYTCTSDVLKEGLEKLGKVIS